MHKGTLYPKFIPSFCLWDPQMVYKRQMAVRYFLRRTVGFFDGFDLVPTYNNTESSPGSYTPGQSVAKWQFAFPNRHGHALRAELDLGNDAGTHLIRGGQLRHYIDNVLCWSGLLGPILSGWDHAFVRTSTAHTPAWFGPQAGVAAIVDPVGW